MNLDALFVFPFSVGAAFFLGGILMQRYPPKAINHFYGYRTPRSMKSQERWEYAQQYSAKLLIRSGLMLFALSFLGHFNLVNESVGAATSAIAVIIAVVILIGKTESSLHSRFKDKAKEKKQ